MPRAILRSEVLGEKYQFYVQRMIASGDLDSTINIGTLRSSIFHLSMMAIKNCWAMVSARHAPSCFHLYIMHVINFARLPRFSACNTEKLREPGDEARLHSLLTIKHSIACTHAQNMYAYTCTHMHAHMYVQFFLTLLLLSGSGLCIVNQHIIPGNLPLRLQVV